MRRTRKKRLNAIVVCCLLAGNAFSQAKSGLENYNQMGHHQEYLWMPILHYQSQKGLYTEFRYNYEEVKTASLFLGKTFERSGKRAALVLTPMIGFSTGTFKGSSLALHTEIDWTRTYLSSQMQYSYSFNRNSQHFYFNWSEAGYTISDKFFAGIALQYTLQQGAHDFQPGLLAGWSIGNFSVPLYLFRPFSGKRFFILGVNYEYQLKGRKKNNSMYLPVTK